MVRHHRRESIIVLIAVSGTLGACGSDAQSEGTDGGYSGGGGACTAPRTVLSDTTVAPGDSIVISGDEMFRGCVDHDSVPDTPPPGWSPSENLDTGPLTDQVIVWRQESSEFVLGAVDADASGVIKITVTVPSNAEPGPAEIQVGDVAPTAVTVTSEH